MSENEEGSIETYGDDQIGSLDLKVPRWLFWSYILTLLWGVVWFYYFWNGSYGWLDRGYWHQLQKAANTTFPIVNYNEVEAGSEKN